MTANARVQATAVIGGRKMVIARGTVRRHKLKLKFKHMHRGTYRVTLLELKRHAKPIVIGHTTITVR